MLMDYKSYMSGCLYRITTKVIKLLYYELSSKTVSVSGKTEVIAKVFSDVTIKRILVAL